MGGTGASELIDGGLGGWDWNGIVSGGAMGLSGTGGGTGGLGINDEGPIVAGGGMEGEIVAGLG